MVEVGNGRGHCWLKSLHLRETYVKKFTILTDIFHFVVVLLQLFFFSYGTCQWSASADRCNKQHKKAVEGPYRAENPLFPTALLRQSRLSTGSLCFVALRVLNVACALGGRALSLSITLLLANRQYSYGWRSGWRCWLRGRCACAECDRWKSAEGPCAETWSQCDPW